MNDLTCFIDQKAFIGKDGELLILHDPLLGFDLPGGKVMADENDLRKSLHREIIEETKLTVEIGPPFYTWLYTIPEHSGYRHAGKKFFCVGYRCSYVSGDIVLSGEHDRYLWINRNNYRQYTDWDVIRAYFA